MGKLIGSGSTENFGERLFIEKAKEYFDDETIIYWNRQVFGREFDVCILLPGKGILVVELKGWREENILRIDNNDVVVIATEAGEITASPQKQARGYRFALERHIKQNTGKYPLVYQMVCLPQVSQAFFSAQRLDVIMEEKFTLLKDDLVDNAVFFAKINQAMGEVIHWKRDAFDPKMMLEVRNLFETNIDMVAAGKTAIAPAPTLAYNQHDYSRFYYFAQAESLTHEEATEIAAQYVRGCKLYCVFAGREQLSAVLSAIDAELTARGLRRSFDNIELAFDSDQSHSPAARAMADTFMGFNCFLTVVTEPLAEANSFMIKNGDYSPSQEDVLRKLSNVSQFNFEQYQVEHATTTKNIVIRAGAGTGKTYTMISRIGFICYAQNVPLQTVAERIVMITFTNDAADQMAAKLKRYFRNYYLLTANLDYLKMISLVDNMQISTIHSYAKALMARLGTSFGYGIDLGITSSEFYRSKKISDLLDDYIQRKELEYGKDYTQQLGMPVYAIRDSITAFIGRLHNKSVNIECLEPQDFGELIDDEMHGELHALLAELIPAVEREYATELLENNMIHLSAMMSLLNRFVSAAGSEAALSELKRDKQAQQFMFVDEFQDTDDSQIESLLRIAAILDYKLFLVGDIKQCIYRFRGAKEKAFDQLGIADNPTAWLEFTLRRNYRTDRRLLEIFDRSFAEWGRRDDELLAYEPANDKLLGTRVYNGSDDDKVYTKERFYRCLVADGEESRIPVVVEEIRRLQRRIEYEENHGETLSAKEKSIAILVRENWQADMIRTECARCGIVVQTNTGGDLYYSQPAIDMLTLANTLVHFDEADYLYSLATSNFFKLDIPRSNLYEIRKSITEGAWRKKTDEREQTNYLIKAMNMLLVNSVDDNNKWEYIVASLRTQPVLQVIRRLYSTLSPWRNFSDDLTKQHYYQLNVDLLFEQIINACNVDRLTINTLQEYLRNSIVAQTPVDSRNPAENDDAVAIKCITVHKSKGLEYGHVILPFCSFSMDYLNKSQLSVSVAKQDNRYRIGYSMALGDSGETMRNDYYDEVVEKSEKAREEARILYVAMTRAIRSFSWVELQGKRNRLSWQKLIAKEV